MTKNKNKKNPSPMSSPSSSSTTTVGAPLIKGYLPVRLRVPKPPQLCPIDDDDDDDGDDGLDLAGRAKDKTDDTYFYVREHQGKNAGSVASTDSNDSSLASNSGCTLFVANAPFIPEISTKVLLRSLLGRFGDVTRVTVVPNPRGARNGGPSLPSNVANTTSLGYSYGDGILNGHISSSALSSSSSSTTAWSTAVEYPSFLPPSLSEGKYAHVVFATPKDLKKTKSALEDIMANKVDSDGNVLSLGSGRKRKKNKRRHKHNHNDPHHQQQQHQDGSEDRDGDDGEPSTPPALTLDSIEIQTLSDESWRQWEEDNRKKSPGTKGDSDDDDDDFDDNNGIVLDGYHSAGKYNPSSNISGTAAIAQRYRDSCKYLTREKLLEECNAVMQAYEDAEDAKKRAQAAAKAQPDDDGFVTVSYSNAVGSKSELEQSVTATTPSRRKGNKRTRKKKDAVGAQQLDDFYRFQRKESRKRTMDELRKQFQLDLQKVKRLKEEKQYRPF